MAKKQHFPMGIGILHFYIKIVNFPILLWIRLEPQKVAKILIKSTSKNAQNQAEKTPQKSSKNWPKKHPKKWPKKTPKFEQKNTPKSAIFRDFSKNRVFRQFSGRGFSKFIKDYRWKRHFFDIFSRKFRGQKPSKSPK